MFDSSLDPPLTGLLETGWYQENIAVGFPCLVSSVAIFITHHQSKAAGWDGTYIWHRTIAHRLFSNPLAAGRCAEGTLQSFSWSKTPPCAAGSGRGLGRIGRDCTPVVNSCSKKWKSGFCTSPSSPSLLPLEWSCASFQEPKRLWDKQCILRYSVWGSSGKIQNLDLQIPGEPGRDLLEIDTFRVKRPPNRIFHRFGLQ